MTTTLGIPSANRLPVSEGASALPTVYTTVLGWFRPLSMGRITSKIIGGEVVNRIDEIRCAGAIQPFDSRKLRIKPEGQRSWDWNMLHVTPDVRLENGEYFGLKGRFYRIMSNEDWTAYGYITYEVLQSYKMTREAASQAALEGIFPITPPSRGDFDATDFSPTDFST